MESRMGINMLLRRIEHLQKGLNFTQLPSSLTLRSPVLGQFSAVQFSCSVMSDSVIPKSMLGLPVRHQLPEFTQTQIH